VQLVYNGAARSFYVILSEVAEQMFMLWVGVLYYMSSFNSLISTTAIGMVSAHHAQRSGQV
jgi:hypothetical protein